MCVLVFITVSDNIFSWQYRAVGHFRLVVRPISLLLVWQCDIWLTVITFAWQ